MDSLGSHRKDLFGFHLTVRRGQLSGPVPTASQLFSLVKRPTTDLTVCGKILSNAGIPPFFIRRYVSRVSDEILLAIVCLSEKDDGVGAIDCVKINTGIANLK